MFPPYFPGFNFPFFWGVQVHDISGCFPCPVVWTIQARLNHVFKNDGKFSVQSTISGWISSWLTSQKFRDLSGMFSMRKKNHRWLFHRMEVKKVHQSWVFNHSKRTLCETLWNKHGAHDWIGGRWATEGNVCLTKRSERFGSNQDKCRKHVNLGTTMGLKLST